MPRHRQHAVDLGTFPRPARRSGRQRLVLAALGSTFALCLLCASLAGYLLVSYANIDRYDDLETDASGGGPENYLVVGSDSRQDAGAEAAAAVPDQRSDTIMIVRIDPAEEAASVLSLPRDLVVPIPGTGDEDRINSAYSTGTPDEGRQLLIDTIRSNFGIAVHHYVEVDFQGFERMVDSIGGVPLYFDTRVRDEESGLYQDEGCATLDGEQALAFVRSRHLEVMGSDGDWDTDPTGDLGRITRQQVFLREAVGRAISEATTSPLAIRELVGIGVDSVGVDGGMGLGDMVALAERFRGFDADRLRTYSLPVVENGDGATVSVAERRAEPVLNLFRGLDPGEVSPELVSVTVLNGSGVRDQANDVAGALDTVGFQVVDIGDAPDGERERTTVLYHPGDEAYAHRLARHVTGGAAYEVDESLPRGEVTLVTGTDLTTIHEQPTPLERAPAPGDDRDSGDDPAAGDARAASEEATGGSGSGESTGGTEATDGAEATEGSDAHERSGAEGAPAEGSEAEPPPVTVTTIGRAIGTPPPGITCD